MKNIEFAAIMPHPPIIVPEIGKGQLDQVAQTVAAMENIANQLKTKDIDTLIVITPHGEVGQASVPVYASHVFEGSFSSFGLPKPLFSFKGDSELGLAVIKDCDFATSCPETLLDHGVLVPLYFLHAAGLKVPILPIAIAFMPLKKLFEFGKSLAATIKRMDRKVAIIASADMSHRLTPDAPAGYSPRGLRFDEGLVKLVKNYDVPGILEFDPLLAEEAGQDALWSIAILLGALDGLKVKHELLSYEGPFGVGYMTAVFEPAHSAGEPE
ncbi:MAG: AmmeMemoRadiSam system protein B [Candidatus Margulisiibacteriota bacterium]